MSDSTLHAACLRHMPLVLGYNNTLDQLGAWWHKVALIGKINSHAVAETLIDAMYDTQQRFQELQGRLIDNLVRENVRKVEMEFNARSQAAIDILIRNLYERAADVGFLATDDDIRAFLLRPESSITTADIDVIVRRLRAYTAKYSVYEEIIILDAQGKVRAHLDERNPIRHTDPLLIAQTLQSKQPYVETFRYSDLQPHRRTAHIFSAPITDGDGPTASVLGVLCLCFRFEDEMRGIFANLARTGEVIAILDNNGIVIASSDEQAAPLGRQMCCHGSRIGVMQDNSEGYLVRTNATRGYQGYYGLAWQGHVMRPLSSAFSSVTTRAEQGLLQWSRLFSDELRTISRNASLVTDDLTLLVLNGQIVSAKRDAAEFMPVLEEIRNIGQRTRGVFDRSIADLYGTVASSLLSEVQFQAFLAVDVMDRNLYERANDVRWWALTSIFRSIMSQPQRNRASDALLSEVLAYINGLYTVYSNLLLYDANGVIVALSNPQEAALLGKMMPCMDTVGRVLRIDDEQHYVVSPFAPTPLYGGRHTYIYTTAVRALDDVRVVGGVAVIFDAASQFITMLTDTLPRNTDGSILAGSFGVFVDRSGSIIASTDAELLPGEKLAVDARFFALRNGECGAAVLEYSGQPYAVGAAMSQGYREYKTSGDYQNDVLALIFVPLRS